MKHAVYIGGLDNDKERAVSVASALRQYYDEVAAFTFREVLLGRYELYAAVEDADLVTHSIGLVAMWGSRPGRILAFAPPFQDVLTIPTDTAINPDPREFPFDDDPDAVAIVIAAGRHGVPSTLFCPANDEYYRLSQQRESLAKGLGVGIVHMAGAHYDFTLQPGAILRQSDFANLMLS